MSARPLPAGARTWEPTAARVEILVALSQILTRGEQPAAAAVEQAAGVLAAWLDDGVAIDLSTDDGAEVLRVAGDHPQQRARSILHATVGRRFRADEGFTACVLDTRSSLLIPRVTRAELDALQPEIAPSCHEIGMRGFVAAPLIVRGTVIGVVWQVRTRPAPPVDEGDRGFLEEVAARLACAVTCWGGRLT